MRKRIGICLGATFFCVSLVLPTLPKVQAQQANSPAPSLRTRPGQDDSVNTIRTSSRLVLLDVVVTDHGGKFVPGLKAGDFTILEDNKPQAVTGFAVQIPAPVNAKATPPLNLPPHVFTNFTSIKPTADRPVTIILMDMMNTTGLDQTYARKQMVKFLEKLPPGQEIALFALTSKLRMIQGFSGDSGTLAAAAKMLEGNESLLLTSEAQTQQDETSATIIENGAGPPGMGPIQPTVTTMPIAPIGQAIRNAVAAQDTFQKLQRMDLTLGALDALAHAVAGYPGRKNLIWLSGDFPVTFAPGMSPYTASVNLQTGNDQTNNQLRDIENDSPPMAQTAALLAAVRLAIYPIDVRGQVSLGTGIDISTPTAGISAADLKNEMSTASLRQTTGLWDAHEQMTDIARETGGRAFYGTNDLNDAIKRSVQQGASYYTLAYRPTNSDWNGKYRKIEVKAAGGADLTYRRGYYAIQEHVLPADRAAVAMTAAMQPTVPEFTGLLLKVQVLPPDAEHKAVRIDYAVDAHDVLFSDSPDKRKVDSIDFAATAWDKDLKLSAHVVETMDAKIRPEIYQQVLKTGLPYHQELQLKPGDYTLRVGVLDRNSRKIGSVGVPVTVPPL